MASQQEVVELQDRLAVLRGEIAVLDQRLVQCRDISREEEARLKVLKEGLQQQVLLPGQGKGIGTGNGTRSEASPVRTYKKQVNMLAMAQPPSASLGLSDPTVEHLRAQLASLVAAVQQKKE